jgi:hypothetical protein
MAPKKGLKTVFGLFCAVFGTMTAAERKAKRI